MNKTLVIAVLVSLVAGGIVGSLLPGGSGGREPWFDEAERFFARPLGAAVEVDFGAALSQIELHNALVGLAEDTANIRGDRFVTSSLNFAMPLVWKCYGVGVPATACPLQVSSTPVYATSTFTGFTIGNVGALNAGDFVLLGVASTTAVNSSTLQWAPNVINSSTVNVLWTTSSITTSSVPVATDLYFTIFRRGGYPALQTSTSTDIN